MATGHIQRMKLKENQMIWFYWYYTGRFGNDNEVNKPNRTEFNNCNCHTKWLSYLRFAYSFEQWSGYLEDWARLRVAGSIVLMSTYAIFAFVLVDISVFLDWNAQQYKTIAQNKHFAGLTDELDLLPTKNDRKHSHVFGSVFDETRTQLNFSFKN